MSDNDKIISLIKSGALANIKLARLLVKSQFGWDEFLIHDQNIFEVSETTREVDIREHDMEVADAYYPVTKEIMTTLTLKIAIDCRVFRGATVLVASGCYIETYNVVGEGVPMKESNFKTLTCQSLNPL